MKQVPPDKQQQQQQHLQQHSALAALPMLRPPAAAVSAAVGPPDLFGLAPSLRPRTLQDALRDCIGGPGGSCGAMRRLRSWPPPLLRLRCRSPPPPWLRARKPLLPWPSGWSRRIFAGMGRAQGGPVRYATAAERSATYLLARRCDTDARHRKTLLRGEQRQSGRWTLRSVWRCWAGSPGSKFGSNPRVETSAL